MWLGGYYPTPACFEVFSACFEKVLASIRYKTWTRYKRAYEGTAEGMKFWSRLKREYLAFLHYEVMKDWLEKCFFEYITMLG